MSEETQTASIAKVFRLPHAEVEREDFRARAWGTPKPIHPTLLHALASAAKLSRGVGITLLPERDGGEVRQKSYAEVYLAARRVAGHLMEAGLLPGERVLIVLPTSFEFVEAFFGVELAGAIPVPGYPPASLQAQAAIDRLSHLAAHARVRFCIATKRLYPLLGGLHLRVPGLKGILPVEALSGPSAGQVRAKAKRADPAFIQYTSGSTGRQKGVLLTHHNLVSNLQATGRALRVDGDDALVTWLPMYHDMGLIGTLLFSVYWRLPLVMMSPVAFLSKPGRWLRAIDRYRGTLSAAPNFAYGLCVKKIKPDEREGLDLSTWRAGLNGAEPVQLRTILDFQNAFAPHGLKSTTMFPVYGLAEATVGVTFPPLDCDPRHELVDRTELAHGYARRSSGGGAVAMVSVGRSLPEHEVRVVDDRGQPVTERTVGNVLFRGPSVMSGYYDDPEATEEILRDGWLWTGDLGYLVDGELFISGRAKDLIILRGRNYHPQDLEQIAERVPGIRPGGAVAFGVADEGRDTERVVLVCETRSAKAGDLVGLREEVSARVGEYGGLVPDEVVLVNPGRLPKTSSGKKQRPLTRSLYLKGLLAQDAPGRSLASQVLLLAKSAAGLFVGRAKRLVAS